MLVLTRKNQQTLVIDNDIVIVVVAINGDRVKLGIEADESIKILRGELHEQQERQKAA